MRLDTGGTGEAATAELYLRRGYRIVARNWRCGLGELDIVAARAGRIVICEVKTRRGAAFGGGYEAVDRRKRSKLRLLADAFLADWPAGVVEVRFDVASVAIGRDGSASVELFEDAF